MILEILRENMKKNTNTHILIKKSMIEIDNNFGRIDFIFVQSVNTREAILKTILPIFYKKIHTKY